MADATGDTVKNDTEKVIDKIGGPSHAMNHILFIVFLCLTGGVIAFFTYKLVSSLRQKQKTKEEKKKQKQQKKEKLESQRKQKKK